MMTANSKKIAIAFLALVFAFGAVKAKANAGLCAKVEDFYARSITQLADKEAKYQDKKLEREKALVEKYAERQAKQDKARANWDSKKDGLFAKLENRAATDEQKQAAAAYQQAVTAAVAAKRAALDAALAEFNAG